MPRKLEPKDAEFKCRDKHHIFTKRVPHWVQYIEERYEPTGWEVANFPEVRCPVRGCGSLADYIRSP